MNECGSELGIEFSDTLCAHAVSRKWLWIMNEWMTRFGAPKVVEIFRGTKKWRYFLLPIWEQTLFFWLLRDVWVSWCKAMHRWILDGQNECLFYFTADYLQLGDKKGQEIKIFFSTSNLLKTRQRPFIQTPNSSSSKKKTCLSSALPSKHLSISPNAVKSAIPHANDFTTLWKHFSSSSSSKGWLAGKKREERMRRKLKHKQNINETSAKLMTWQTKNLDRHQQRYQRTLKVDHWTEVLPFLIYFQPKCVVALLQSFSFFLRAFWASALAY